MELERLPRHLLIVGGGYVGLEFASIYRSFGSEVTVLEQRSEFLPGQSRDIATEVKQTMEKQGIQFLLNAHVQSIHDRTHGTAIHYLDEHGVSKELECDVILVAVGRVPNTSQLALEKAGIAVNERGFIEVDEYLRTNVANIWAIGDINGGPQFTYISLDDYRIIRDQFDGESHYSTQVRQNVPSAVVIAPPLAHVGLAEEGAVHSFAKRRQDFTPVSILVKPQYEVCQLFRHLQQIEDCGATFSACEGGIVYQLPQPSRCDGLLSASDSALKSRRSTAWLRLARDSEESGCLAWLTQR